MENNKMITHYMQNKQVSWNTLEKIKLGRTVEYIRRNHEGTVIDVSQCGGLCLVLDSKGEKHEIETPELDVLD